MRTQTAFASAAALLVLVSCVSCGGGGSGGSAGDSRAVSAEPLNVALTWRGGDDDVAGYVIHWGNVAHAYAHEIDVSKPAADADGNVTIVVAIDRTDVALAASDAAPTYYFAITSYDAERTSSGYSNELSTDGGSVD